MLHGHEFYRFHLLHNAELTDTVALVDCRIIHGKRRETPNIIFAAVRFVDDAKRKEYMDRLIENQRVIDKVSDEKTKKARCELVAEYEKN